MSANAHLGVSIHAAPQNGPQHILILIARIPKKRPRNFSDPHVWLLHAGFYDSRNPGFMKASMGCGVEGIYRLLDTCASCRSL